jgi:hypothetical protein
VTKLTFYLDELHIGLLINIFIYIGIYVKYYIYIIYIKN